MESKQRHQEAAILAERVKELVSIIPEDIEATTRKKPGYLINVVLPSLKRFNENLYFLSLSDYEKTESGFLDKFLDEIKSIDLNRVFRLVSYCQCYNDELSRKIAEETKILFNCLIILLNHKRIFEIINGDLSTLQIYDEETSPFARHQAAYKSPFDSQYLAFFKTSQGNKIIEGLLKAGIIEEAGEVWKWKATKALFCYFCVESTFNVYDLRPELNNKIQWAKFTPLFGLMSDEGYLRSKLALLYEPEAGEWIRKPKGSRKIDDIINKALN